MNLPVLSVFFLISVLFFSCKPDESTQLGDFSFELNRGFTIPAGLSPLNINTRTFADNTNLLLANLQSRGLTLDDVREVRVREARWVSNEGAVQSLNFIQEAIIEIDDFDTPSGGIEIAFVLDQTNRNVGSILTFIPSLASADIFLEGPTYDLLTEFRTREITNRSYGVELEIIFDVFLN